VRTRAGRHHPSPGPGRGRTPRGSSSWRAAWPVDFLVSGLIYGLIYGLMAGVLLAAPLAGQSREKPAEFKRAIQAQDYADWQGSLGLLRKALQVQPEDGQSVRIYGTRYRGYLPHYYIGLALAKLDDCPGAIAEWEISQEVGAVQATPEYDALLKALASCRARLSAEGKR
jgi:hypothetical protein